MRFPAEALLRARQANAATDGRRPEMLDTLAAAYDANDNLTAALKAEREALAAVETGGRTDWIRPVEEKVWRLEARQSR